MGMDVSTDTEEGVRVAFYVFSSYFFFPAAHTRSNSFFTVGELPDKVTDKIMVTGS